MYVQQINSASHQVENRVSDYFISWKYLNGIKEEAYGLFPKSSGGFLEKCYMQAVRNIGRIYDKHKYELYYKEYLQFVKRNGKFVLLDSNNNMKNRALGLAGMISPIITCEFCTFLLNHGFYLRKTA